MIPLSWICVAFPLITESLSAWSWGVNNAPRVCIQRLKQHLKQWSNSTIDQRFRSTVEEYRIFQLQGAAFASGYNTTPEIHYYIMGHPVLVYSLHILRCEFSKKGCCWCCCELTAMPGLLSSPSWDRSDPLQDLRGQVFRGALRSHHVWGLQGTHTKKKKKDMYTHILRHRWLENHSRKTTLQL